jgi:hypothetical protein
LQKMFYNMSCKNTLFVRLYLVCFMCQQYSVNAIKCCHHWLSTHIF